MKQNESAEQILSWAASATGLSGPAAFPNAPKDPALAVNLLTGLGILDPTSTPSAPFLTEPGRGVLTVMLDLDT